MEATAIAALSTHPQTVNHHDLSGISGDDFMKLLIQQLQNQDPFSPMSNEEMVAQMSTIRELEMNTRLSESLAQVTTQQRYGAAAALIGKYAEGIVTDGEGNVYPYEGIITGIRFTEKGEVMLELDTGETMPMSGLTKVTNANEAV
jgi:flagellar basal-body rod modification protein FlgD